MTSPSPDVQTSPAPAAAELLADRRPAPLPARERPRLVVVVDTEEEFDWHAPFDRGATSVEALRDLAPFQELCEARNLCPTYVIDHPVAARELGRSVLGPWREAGRALIGAHLHPWVSPPHEEAVSARNSYPGNLPEALEAAKLERLTATIEDGFGFRPTIYKAGRYGFGPRTAGILARLGYRIDLSCCAGFDLRADGGPDWSGFGPGPYWFGPGHALLGLPTTGGFAGWLSAGGRRLFDAAQRLRAVRLPGVLSRAGALERLLLSPEGYGQAHLRRLTRALLRRGERAFTFSLHSPSLRPGCTPYVRTAEERAALLAACRQYFDWFLGELGGLPATPPEILGLLERARPAPTPSTGRAA